MVNDVSFCTDDTRSVSLLLGDFVLKRPRHRILIDAEFQYTIRKNLTIGDIHAEFLAFSTLDLYSFILNLLACIVYLY